MENATNTICQIFVDAYIRLHQNDKLSDEAKDFFRQELDKLRQETAIVQERQDKLRQEIANKAFEVANEINSLRIR